ncbi:2-hydroxychromene-2-carboxylate isomerase [Aquabacter cavernae]|uniref:2-hydroxychromene-2-carboxylate isomerase n=1 Tax=Aquabacter cavernae TaxID=2496029 RepID=UPI000F8C5EC9|nr:2-hydroxychromene-2-carboxylate isomerase [Aquabacter cavernae]
MSRTIEYFFSFASPWSFLGHAPFMEVVARHGVEVDYVPVNLGPVFAETGGLPLAKRAPARQRYRMMELQRWRVKRGVDFHLAPRFWPFDPSTADRAVIAALAHGPVDGLLARLYSAVWQRQENLGDPAELARIIDEMGLPGAAIVADAQGEATGAAYEANRQRALDAGMFGAPSYVLEGEVFWGQDRVELLDDALSSGRAPFTA